MLLEKTPESPLASKEIKAVNPKVNQPGIFIERTDAEAQAPVLCDPLLSKVMGTNVRHKCAIREREVEKGKRRLEKRRQEKES